MIHLIQKGFKQIRVLIINQMLTRRKKQKVTDMSARQ